MVSLIHSLRLFAEYLVSVMVWAVFTPWGWAQTARQMGGQWLALTRALRQPPAAPAPDTWHLPVEGSWKVHNGGPDRATSHSWDLVSQRYAYDLVMTDARGQTARQPNTHDPAQFWAWGQPIVAIGAGQVVAARADLRDAPRANTGWVDWQARDIRGNYVVIQHAPNLFSLYAHLQRHSVTVSAGQRVQAGEVIGRCGNSGHSSEPHLHFQVQDRADFFTALGVPVRFAHFEQMTADQPAQPVRTGYLRRGQWVRALPASTAGLEEPPITPPSITVWEWLGHTAVVTLSAFGLLALVLRALAWLGLG